MYEVWLEAYIDQGPQFVGGILLGTVEAKSFEEACIKVMKDDPDRDLYWDAKRPTTYWGIRLVSSKEQAIERVPESWRHFFPECMETTDV